MSDPNPQGTAVETPLTDLLRKIKADAWAEIVEESGWTYSTNIGVLAHRAADKIDELTARAEKAEARAEQAEAENERLRAQVDEQVRRSIGNLHKLQETLHTPRGVAE